ncbi:MAG: lipopolysaccharide biosynthesis protein [Bacteroidaceae bacterium]|nr:lipopolysaccharide biosynthesis protein [Bacteroidaceae bacterium]MBR5275547.1 lipopolysaccharide biosynthesis protein [Bacteroidaceae bacterium]
MRAMGNGNTQQDLKHAVAKGFLWGGMSNVVCQFLSLLFGIYLARILGPNDYGPIGMLAIFSAIAGSLQESGFVQAIANRKKVGHDDYNAVFWFNILVSVLMYVALYLSAPIIADFFNQPVLVPLSRYNFLGFVVAAFGIAPSAYLFRELKVKQKSIALILSIALSGVVGVVMALNGYSYWGIATQSIVYVLVRTVVCWYFTPWTPSLKVNFAPLKYLFAFSYRLLITSVFQRFNWNVFSFILGKFYTRIDVGNYTKSAEWFNMGGEVVNGMVNAVAQPALAKVVNDSERQLRVFRKMLRFTAFVSFPLMLGLSLVSKELIVLVITEKWLESAGMLQMLAVWGAFMPIQSMFTNLLVSCGRSRTFMWCTIVQGLLMFGILLIIHRMGIKPMIVSYCVFNVLWLFVWLYFAKKEIDIKLSMFMRDILPYMLLSLFVMAVAYVSTMAIEDMYLLFVSKVAIAASLYVFIARLIRSEELNEIKEFLYK